MTRDLKWERVYPHPAERVWRALTDREALAAWLMENDFEPRVGHRFQFRTRSSPRFDAIINCEVLEVNAPTRLSYRWKTTAIDTVMSFTLQAEGSATRLRVEMIGFTGLNGHLTERFAFRISSLFGSGVEGMCDGALPRLLNRMVMDPFGHVWALRGRTEKATVDA